jgi:CRP-like cAMP-binding protein
MFFKGIFAVRMAGKRSSGNRILQSLSSSDFSALSPDLKTVELSEGSTLFDPQQNADYTYFPLNSIISFSCGTGKGQSVEVYAVGSEGVAGVAGLLTRTMPFRGVVQVAGTALRSKTSVLRKRFEQSSAFHEALLSYVNHLLVQISYIGICNSRHSIEHRFSRWLLMTHDRIRADVLNFTQGSIATALGTRRATISVAAAALQNAGLISYKPGMITIRSRRALEDASCGCYRIIKTSG